MPQVEKIKIFLASPRDVANERRYVEEVIREINDTVASSKDIVLELVHSGKTYPGYGQDGQAVLNAQIASMEEYALFVGIMWNRVGTPTPRAESGTIEEFERAVEAFKSKGQPKIWFYFREAPARFDKPEELEQRQKVLNFRQELQRQALTHSYRNPSKFRDKFRNHITLWLNQRENKTSQHRGNGELSSTDLEQAERSPVSSSSQRIIQTIIEDKTKDFVGREYVFSAIAQFISTQPNGYFTLIGDPGQGKSAILAKYVQDTDCIAHFNVQLQGFNRADQFLESVCTQLIDRYQLSHQTLPANATGDGNFLSQLLQQVTQGSNNEPIVIAVDALDEVDPNSYRDANILYLPPHLPTGIYFVMTRRRGVEVPFTTYTPLELLHLMDYQEDSHRDIRQYIQNRLEGSEQLRQRIDDRRETQLEFAQKIAAKTDNNFMYLRYMLQDIEKGLYQDLSLESFPQGLQGYYEFHWRRMGMTAKPLPEAKIKIVYVLVEIGYPVSRQLISECAKENRLKVQEVLDDWKQFLHTQEIDGQTCYNIYHTSFADFLHRKDIVQAANVDVKNINTLIADDLWEGLYGNE